MALPLPGAVAFLEPPLAALCPSLRRTRAFRLPARLASWMVLAEEHSCSDALAEFAGCALAALFLVYRNDDAYGCAAPRCCVDLGPRCTKSG